jgi:2-oxoisovalerate dehydrogenase E2 component (dihydrolipoyl transacylase)
VKSFAFQLPDLGEGVVEAEIVAWHVQPGDRVAEDEPLLDVITDKATVTIPSAVAGRIIQTHGQVGDTVSVGNTLVELDITVPEAAPDAPDSHASLENCLAAAAPHGSASPTIPLSTASTNAASQRPLASPAVRRRAREEGVDLRAIPGISPGGYVTHADIDSYLCADGESANGHVRVQRTGTTELPITGLRRQIARKMAVSHRQIPHYSYLEEIDLTELAKLRRHVNSRRTADEAELTYLPFIMLALAKALRSHPEVNAHFDEQREVVKYFEAVHLGIATQTERGLTVPVVRHVETMNLWEAAQELQRVTQAARQNSIQREELTGSTFTISSLGKIGGLAATPIINHPEVGILGVHRASDRPVALEGQVVIRHMVNVSASFDHRVVDGVQGATLIQTLKEYLEQPAMIFM